MSEERDYQTIVEAVLYNENGRITGYRQQAIGFTQDDQDRGERIMLGDPAWQTNPPMSKRYVKLTGKKPVLVDRPVFDRAFSRTELPVREEASLLRVPACTVRFDGPVSGTHEHPGGTLKVGFTVPGTYTISFEAFPAMPCTHELTVTP